MISTKPASMPISITSTTTKRLVKSEQREIILMQVISPSVVTTSRIKTGKGKFQSIAGLE